MKDTGIIMSGDHPLKCLDGAKTMTRRTWGMNYINKAPDLWIYVGLFEGVAHFDIKVGCEEEADRVYGVCKNLQEIKCPYGGVGDILVMRETWATENRYNNLKPSELPGTARIFYLASETYDPFMMGIVRSPLHLPFMFSRGRLKITEEKAERLQEISEADIKAEGFSLPLPAPAHRYTSYFDVFSRRWDSLNAKRGYGWETNPWVWVISFERSSPENIQHRGLAGQSGLSGPHPSTSPRGGDEE